MPREKLYHHDEAEDHIASKAACVHYTFAGTALNAWHDRMCCTAKHDGYSGMKSRANSLLHAGRQTGIQIFWWNFATQRRMLTSSKASYWLGTGSDEHGAL